MIANLPSNFANAVTPFVPFGRQAVGQESEDLRASPLKPLEQASESARRQNRRAPEDNPNLEGEASRVRRQGGTDGGSGEGATRSQALETAGSQPGPIVASPDQVPAGLAPGTQIGTEEGASVADQATVRASLPEERPSAGAEGDREQQVRREVERQRQLQEQQQIRQLAARDREVRQHEQAHVAAGGRFASAPSFEFVRGPDGVNYAVAGEVQIDTSPVPGDPEATAQKAQQIRRAANAPLEPSAADRRVAAEAARMEAEAQQEVRQEAAEERREAREANEPEQTTGAEPAIASEQPEGPDQSAGAEQAADSTGNPSPDGDSPPTDSQPVTSAGAGPANLAGTFSQDQLAAGGNNTPGPRLDDLTSSGALNDTRPPTGSTEAFRRLLEGGLLGSSSAPGRLLDQRV